MTDRALNILLVALAAVADIILIANIVHHW